MTIWPRHAAVFAFLALTGCGGVGDVTGKVTCDGKPVQVGTVVVLGSDSLPYTSRIDPGGVYRVEKVPLGQAKFGVISVNPKTPRPGRDMTADGRVKGTPEDAASNWFAIPDRYGDLATTDLVFDIRRGANQFDIVLIADKVADKKAAK
jgi:hypothetical protein